MPRFEQSVYDITLPVEDVYSSGQLVHAIAPNDIVTINANGKATLCTSANIPFGVVVDRIPESSVAAIRVLGVAECIAGGSITA